VILRDLSVFVVTARLPRRSYAAGSQLAARGQQIIVATVSTAFFWFVPEGDMANPRFRRLLVEARATAGNGVQYRGS
jgi:hypothetical protein